MATMGRRKIAKTKVLSKPADKPLAGIGHMPINLVISPIQIQTITTQRFEFPVFGVPIMREGFITETGLLLGSSQSTTIQTTSFGVIGYLAFPVL